jgi:hypothetical protein
MTEEAKEPKKYILKRPKPTDPEVPRHDGFIDTLKDVFVDAAIAKDDEKDLSEAKERFSVRDRDSASWAAGKIAMWEAEVGRRKLQAEEYIKDAERRLRHLEWMFFEALRQWAKSNLETGKRSIKLPTATLSFRETQEKLEIADPERLKKWVILNCPDAIETVEKVLMDPLKEKWAKDGTIPEGAKVIPAGENFSIKGS